MVFLFLYLNWKHKLYFYGIGNISVSNGVLDFIPKRLTKKRFPKRKKTKYEKELKMMWHRLHKMLIRQRDYEAEIYEKDIRVCCVK